MSRVQLEQLNIEGLRELARRHGLDSRGTRAVLFDRLSDNFERTGWPDQFMVTGPSGSEDRASTEDSSVVQAEGTGATSGDIGNPNIQEIVQAVLQALESNSGIRPRGESIREPDRQISGPPPSPSNGSQASALQNWHQVKFSSKLIPSFTGQEEENVVLWLERIVSIGRLYQLTDDVLVLAAVNKLEGRALSWYNRQSVDTVATWEDFKFQIRAFFQRKESVTTTLARVGTRTWKIYSEKFADYAEDKLKLLQSLKLTEKEKIELLADGVKDPSLRRFALDSWATTVPEFIEHIRRITEDTVVRRPEQSRRSFPAVPPSANHMICTYCKKTGHQAKDRRLAQSTCYNCGQRGHLSHGCSRKKTAAPDPTLNLLAEGALVEDPIEEGSLARNTDSVEEPCLMSAAANNINFVRKDVPYINVYSLGNMSKPLRTLVDTGSPVSLVRKSVYTKHFADSKLLRVRDDLNLKGINNSSLTVYGKICDQIQLEKLEDQWFDITLLVVNDDTISFDMLLGREFFVETQIRVTYHNGAFEFEAPTDSNIKVSTIFAIDAIEERSCYDIVSENLDDDLDFSAKEQLLTILHEIDSQKLEPIKDNFMIRVHLKDTSFFRYSPRRMSFQEEKELREITDDLLVRGIIKPSISPYCSRVVLVNKRNGTKRMCVDLRPLNQRIFPQKFPFPIIEEQLDQLCGKEIFTKLDLKDGFHQLDIHPDDTKYFSFATPYGQFEYVKMPFGYSEAPAEFQKRLLYIFDALLCSDSERGAHYAEELQSGIKFRKVFIPKEEN
ncbi:uncharacterized protein LOC143264115 [Megachile rotundata]|uniref:uncharacterized protein LOC143264115 n=1 Tax=Megachile rotundata TaxID=143995 RepID=UPI003FD3B79C